MKEPVVVAQNTLGKTGHLGTLKNGIEPPWRRALPQDHPSRLCTGISGTIVSRSTRNHGCRMSCWSSLSRTPVIVVLSIGSASAISAPPPATLIDIPSAQLHPLNPKLPPENTVDTTGIVVLGPWGDRRAFAPLDKVMMPRHFLGAWAEAEEGCDATPAPTPTDDRTEGMKIVITTTYIIAPNGKLSYLGSYAKANGNVSRRQIERGKPILLRSGKFRNSGEITVRVAGNGNQRVGYLTLRKTSEPMAIEILADGRRTEKFVRCFLSE